MFHDTFAHTANDLDLEINLWDDTTGQHITGLFFLLADKGPAHLAPLIIARYHPDLADAAATARQPTGIPRLPMRSMPASTVSPSPQ